jgi:hypothetical protein
LSTFIADTDLVSAKVALTTLSKYTEKQTEKELEMELVSGFNNDQYVFVVSKALTPYTAMN